MRHMLNKLTIEAYEKADYSGPVVAKFVAFLNPSELTLSWEVEFDSAQGAGTNNSRRDFKKAKPGDLSLDFFLDGTGANGSKNVEVQEQITQFQNVTGYSGDIHRPHYLKIAWGTLTVMRCVLKSASIKYKLFKSDGVPLRAVISATFTDNADDKTRVGMAQDQSADLTHVRLTRAGDTLPGLCTQIYGNPRLYVQVARANRLPLFRRLEPGTRLVFPPLEK
jgi:hypothetical protein